MRNSICHVLILLFIFILLTRNKNELKQNIDRIENGILVEDINTCYLNIGERFSLFINHFS